MFFPMRFRALTMATAMGTAAAMGLLLPPSGLEGPARAQGTPGLLEFRWDDTKDYRKLYYYMSDTVRLKRAEYYLLLRPKDRKTALLKLSLGLPSHFDSEISAGDIKLCRMREGGMLKRTRCLETIPAAIEVSPDGRGIDIFPETPVSEKETIGVYMQLFNPSRPGMYQFNALGQSPGDLPISGYLGSWLIQVDAN
jgi:hypothetical protein